MQSLVDYMDSRKWNGSDNRFVIILGSGFHKQALGKHESLLSDWGTLLHTIAPKNFIPTGNYILDFEKIVTQRTGNQEENAAYKIEEKLLSKVSAIITREQTKVKAKYAKKYPMDIFNSDLVSDVISLNFDLIPELLLGGKESKATALKDKDGKRLTSSRHRNIKGVTFWHPHGDISDPNSLLLGLRKYGNRIHECEELRKRFKADERAPKRSYKSSWFDKLVNQPVLVLGASLDPAMEWDIWFALVNRERNFAKKKNRSSQSPMFKMSGQPLTKSGDDLFGNILTASSYNQQWKIVKDCFSKHSKYSNTK